MFPGSNVSIIRVEISRPLSYWTIRFPIYLLWEVMECWKCLSPKWTFTTPLANLAAGHKFLIFILFFSENTLWHLMPNCLPSTRFAWNVKVYFMGNIRQTFQYFSRLLNNLLSIIHDYMYLNDLQIIFITIVVLKFELVQFTTPLCLKVRRWVANSVDPEETPRLICVYTVCSGLSVRIHAANYNI